MILAGHLFDPPVATAETDPRRAQAPLYPGEEATLGGAIARRRREFAAGRACARQAMAALGEEPVCIPQGLDRAPVWPAGIVGSIAHSDTWCAAAMARTTEGIRALGLDIEPDEPLPADCLDSICLDEERRFLETLDPALRGRLGRVLFSAKECVYKCQYTLSRQLLDFHDIRIVVGPGEGKFEATFLKDAGPIRAGSVWHGRLSMDCGHIVTAMCLQAAAAP